MRESTYALLKRLLEENYPNLLWEFKHILECALEDCCDNKSKEYAQELKWIRAVPQGCAHVWETIYPEGITGHDDYRIKRCTKCQKVKN
jgi:hypothetical protein